MELMGCGWCREEWRYPDQSPGYCRERRSGAGHHHTTNIAGAEPIAVIAVNNPAPLIASYDLGEGNGRLRIPRIKDG